MKALSPIYLVVNVTLYTTNQPTYILVYTKFEVNMCCGEGREVEKVKRS